MEDLQTGRRLKYMVINLILEQGISRKTKSRADSFAAAVYHVAEGIIQARRLGGEFNRLEQ